MNGDHAVAAVEQSDARSETLYAQLERSMQPLAEAGQKIREALGYDDADVSPYTDEFGWWEVVAQNLKDAEAELHQAYEIVEQRIEVNMPESLAGLYGNITKERYSWAKRRLEGECKNDAQIDIEDDGALLVFGRYDRNDVQEVVAVAIDWLGMVVEDEWTESDYMTSPSTYLATLKFKG